MSISWDVEKYSVGITRFDAQHQKLFDLIDQLKDGIEHGKGERTLNEIFAGLFDYTVTHFKDEEKAMSDFKYPFFENHKRDHDELLMKINDFYARYEDGEEEISMDVFVFLVEWLYKHIAETDRRYGAYFIEQGIVI